MRLEGYEIIRELLKTDHSVIYEAKASGSEWGALNYIIKKYEENSPKSDVRKEIAISQHIENYSAFSVSIPILREFQAEGCECLLMQQKKSGVFLKEIFGKTNEELVTHDLFQVLEIVEKILTSLEALHGFVYEGEKDKILHLDLHPGNIFIENYKPGEIGTVKFIDFSNAFEEQLVNRVVGIDPYPSGYSAFSAPELFENETEKLCEGTDLFSVASIMLWMMTGRPYRSDTFLADAIDSYGEKEHLPSVLRYAVIQFLQCGFEYNTLYRFKTAFEMKKAVLQLKELVQAVNKYEYTQVLAMSYDMAIPYGNMIKNAMEYNAAGFSKAIKEFENNMKVYQIDVPRRRYEFNYYWAMVKDQNDIDDTLMQRIIRCGIAVCNYSSDTILGEGLRRKYEEYRDNIPVMEYLGLSARLAEQDIDKCRYQKAYERDIRSLKCMKLIKETYRSCADFCGIKGSKSIEYKDLARMYSATGRCVSFLANECKGELRMTRRSEALHYFISALDEFGDDAINRQITLCHLLHLMIDMRDKELFEKYAGEYFGVNSADEWFKGVEEGDAQDLYRLHLCLKSIYYLYPESAGEELNAKLLLLLDNLTRSDSDYPIELVYKYIGLLLFRNGQEITDKVYKAFRYALSSTEAASFNSHTALDITEITAYQTWAIYNEVCGRKADMDTVRGQLLKRCSTDGWNELSEKLENGLPLTELLSYEYS